MEFKNCTHIVKCLFFVLVTDHYNRLSNMTCEELFGISKYSFIFPFSLSPYLPFPDEVHVVKTKNLSHQWIEREAQTIPRREDTANHRLSNIWCVKSYQIYQFLKISYLSFFSPYFSFQICRRGGRGKDKKSQSPVNEEPKPYLDDKYSKSQIIEYDVREVVRLPAGMDVNEWLGSSCKWWRLCVCGGVLG